MLRDFLSSRNGRIGVAATSEQVADLQHQAEVLGRVLKLKDASVVGSAINENAPLITRDARLQKFLKEVGIPTESF